MVVESENIRQMRCSNIGGLDEVAAEMLRLYPEERIFALSGPMGAGKTTFIQAVCRQLGVGDNVNSPTFSIVNEYLTTSNESVFHFDLYRLRKPEELMDIGYEEYFYSGAYCFIEWPELAESLLPGEGVMVSVEVEDDGNARIFSFSRISG